MDCPFCDQPLEQFLSFSEIDTLLINSLPYVIAYPLKRWDVSFIKVLTKNKSATLITQSE